MVTFADSVSRVRLTVKISSSDDPTRYIYHKTIRNGGNWTATSKDKLGPLLRSQTSLPTYNGRPIEQARGSYGAND
jgi:hypothetical protein